MYFTKHSSRRSFMQTSLGLAVGLNAVDTVLTVRGDTPGNTRNDSATHSLNSIPRLSILKAAKWDMIEVSCNIREKFQLQKELGYDGMELISPSDFDPADVRRASDDTAMPVHGVVDLKHWKFRLSSPDPKQREMGLSYLLESLQDAKAFGGSSVLLVPGRVSGPDETHDHVWKRSICEIRKALPLASNLGVRVLIENVWNGFCEDPEQFREYIDEINSPWVGVYFDIGNAQKFGPSDRWINTLGHRIVKLDCKDWGQVGGFGKIGEGDVDWAAVRRELTRIGFSGWCTAEVTGGGRDVLAEISKRMDRALKP